MKIAMTGASGFVANALKKRFPDVVVIERSDDLNTIVQKLKGVYAVFNLAGAPIAAKWDEAYKKVLWSSRIETTKKLVEAINQSEVEHLISTSAVGIYPSNVPSDERSEKLGEDFLAHLAIAWEGEARKCTKKTTIVRFGVVLGRGGGALEKMLPAFRIGLGGIIGNGAMVMSWVDIDDLVSIYAFVLEHQLEGIFNATSPQPLTNFRFTTMLGKVLRRPTFFPVPAFIIKMLFGEGATVLLDSKEAYPKALLEKGFVFEYGDLEHSLRKILA
ncbi:TIGR01777 family oxidoreductase [Sulfurospirillum barnesii]|uniref:TIGR01777 family protein n=1 Tax=Sulfurospirillum barnesii (strain ATCC 700032 / DSM 10660 / SES-3) TaxID=760154 RepID=I3XZQ1_SULBS|nr:TIGR01777 family oxidoreductase [Sulfurospirillum barnesii]AFL69425.1 TIGR01777 family protein [Sulfurospirillum barnesii SES-3]